MKSIPYIIGFLTFVISLYAAFYILKTKHISEWTFCFLVTVSVFIGIWIAYSPRIGSFDLGVGKISMVLNEIRDTKEEIKEREERVQKLAGLVADLITYSDATSLKGGGPEAQDEWLKIKLAEIRSLSNTEIDNPFWRFIEKMDKRDENNEDELKQIWNDFYADIEKEVIKLKNKK